MMEPNGCTAICAAPYSSRIWWFYVDNKLQIEPFRPGSSWTTVVQIGNQDCACRQNIATSRLQCAHQQCRHEESAHGGIQVLQRKRRQRRATHRILPKFPQDSALPKMSVLCSPKPSHKRQLRLTFIDVNANWVFDFRRLPTQTLSFVSAASAMGVSVIFTNVRGTFSGGKKSWPLGSYPDLCNWKLDSRCGAEHTACTAVTRNIFLIVQAKGQQPQRVNPWQTPLPFVKKTATHPAACSCDMRASYRLNSPLPGPVHSRRNAILDKSQYPRCGFRLQKLAFWCDLVLNSCQEISMRREAGADFTASWRCMQLWSLHTKEKQMFQSLYILQGKTMTVLVMRHLSLALN